MPSYLLRKGPSCSAMHDGRDNPSDHAIRICELSLDRLQGMALGNPDRECCGLLAGDGAVISEVFPATNAAKNCTNAYEIPPEELFRLLRAIRGSGFTWMGIYHSHPDGNNHPSARDIDCAYYPNLAYFIVSPRPDSRRPCRAFSIREGRSLELDIEVVQIGRSAAGERNPGSCQR